MKQLVRLAPAGLALLLLLLVPAPAWADALDDVKARGALRWGADEEGGGPYVYRDQQNRLVGFETDLMHLLAGRLGVRSDFKQGQWDQLINLLLAGNVDVVVNGYELLPEHLERALATIPYYVYELHLFARQNDSRLTGWESLDQPRPGGGLWRVGVLTDTAAAKYLKRTYAGRVAVRDYNGTADAFRDVANGNLDATLTDTPAAVFYGPQFPVKQVGPPRQRGYYVMYLRPGDERLRDELDAGLKEALADGQLKAILAKYGLWNAAQEQLSNPEVQAQSRPRVAVGERPGNWQIVRQYLRPLAQAAVVTVLLSVVSMPLAMLMGLLVAVGRLYGPWLVRAPLTAYVEILRGTPLLLQLLVIYFGVPAVVAFPDWLPDYWPYVAAVAGLALNYSAYESEIYRAGLLAIPIGQMEAALALGLTRRQALWRIVVPQAVRLVVPPVTNDFINLFKDTAVCSVITVVELSKQYNMAVNNQPRAFAELALVTAGLYLLMSYPLARLSRRLEKRQAMVQA